MSLSDGEAFRVKLNEADIASFETPLTATKQFLAECICTTLLKHFARVALPPLSTSVGGVTFLVPQGFPKRQQNGISLLGSHWGTSQAPLPLRKGCKLSFWPAVFMRKQILLISTNGGRDGEADGTCRGG